MASGGFCQWFLFSTLGGPLRVGEILSSSLLLESILHELLGSGQELQRETDQGGEVLLS